MSNDVTARDLTARDVMVPLPRTIDPDGLVDAGVAAVLASTGGVIPVLDAAGHLVGVLTAARVLGVAGARAREIMDRDVVTIGADLPIDQVVLHHRQHIMVADTNQRIIGSVSTARLAGALYARLEKCREQVAALQKSINELSDARKVANTLEAVLEHAYDGIIVVDENGIVTMFNRAYEEFLGVPRGEMIGRHVADVVENTRMHIVLKTGIPEIGWTQRIKGQDMVVQRIPIIDNGRVVGAVGKVMFKDVSELKALAQRLNLLEKKVEYYENELRVIRGARYTLNDIVGTSPAITTVKDLIRKAARTHSTVLIRGESGTGKELVAHAIHHEGPRAHGPFVRVNCAAIPRDLLEAELFGYEGGAFTGARKGGKPGKFELASGGTIFLDEIGDMSLEMQAKVLRVLQEREVDRVGGDASLPVDVRVIAATNQDLEGRMREGSFRPDLFYRLNVITIVIPPLRDRREDIPLLARFLVARLCEEQGIPARALSSEALHLLEGYGWPGNVRELMNVLERAINAVDDLVIDVSHLPVHLRRRSLADSHPGQPLREVLEAVEKEVIIDVLRQFDGNVVRAARHLGIHRSALYLKMAKYGLDKKGTPRPRE